MKKPDHRSKQEKGKSKIRYLNIGDSIVIDFFPQGKSLSSKQINNYNPLAVVVTIKQFRFFDVILARNKRTSIKDHLLLSTKNKSILRWNEISYNHLSNSAINILPFAINEIVRGSESFFIDFVNQAHPLTTQMHQLQLLPGIGHKRLWIILDARKTSLFNSYDDFAKRTGISDPISIFSNRILIELEGAQKYYLFTAKKVYD